MIRNHLLKIAAGLLALILFPTGAGPRAQESGARVLVLPFTIHAAKDLGFLQSGIRDMLSTRLTREGESLVVPTTGIETPPANEAEAAALGDRRDVDYVLFGSLTMVGESISTDARFVDVSKGTSAVVFHDTGGDEGAVISHIDRLAGKINREVFGVATEPAPEPEAGRRAEAPVSRPGAPPADTSRRHPEAIWAEHRGTAFQEAEGEPREREGGIRVSRRSDDIWRSRNFDREIVALAVGDVDGDGMAETVFIDERNVLVYRHINGRFVKIAEVSGNVTDTYVTVDVADINGNGLAEIFVNRTGQDGQNAHSLVLEWNGTGLSEIADAPNWYHRVLEIPGRGKVLLGQQQGNRDVFSGDVHEMRWMAGEYVPGDPMGLPRKVELFEFALGDLFNDGRRMIVTFTENDHIRVLGPDGSEAWSSGEAFGGSTAYIDRPAEASSSIGTYRETDRYFIPQRLHVVDSDGDGRNELIVVRNIDTARRLFSKLRMFKAGQIVNLEWDKVGVYERWKTREMPGYISDYVVADMNNDGQRELGFAVVVKTAGVLGDARSFVAYQEFPEATAGGQERAE